MLSVLRGRDRRCGCGGEDCLEQYAFTKRACQAAALRDIADLADPLDAELPKWMTSEHAQHAHRRYWQQLKGRPAQWSPAPSERRHQARRGEHAVVDPDRLPPRVTWQQRPFPDAKLLLLPTGIRPCREWLRRPRPPDRGLGARHTGQLSLVINTHWPADHVRGNGMLQARASPS